jgi:probable addiction module antidote protein
LYYGSAQVERFQKHENHKGMAQIAQELNLDRASLYKSLDGNPSFFTVVKVLNNLGYRINIQQKQAS